MNPDDTIKIAADEIKKADIFVFTAGAGIGVDSGLPDFRGDRGFWRAYPMYEKLGLSFVDCANPIHFESDPYFGWGFYGHRLNMYRETTPNKGFNILLKWGKEIAKEYFVVTSNVDGQFQKAGFEEEKVYEIHGSIHYLQCVGPCCDEIWFNNEIIEIDIDSMRAKNIPSCKHCNKVARPNILMFGDYSWLSHRSNHQRILFEEFLRRNSDKRIVVIEIGAGTAIPSIRYTGERIISRYNAFLIRINPREYYTSDENAIGIPSSGLKALESLDNILS
ncbi:SIR2 family NAD-dependent protein deacylase [Calditerrivibrio nitroreducens]|uniref:protein acetyllysine N-acetyltransferase n=1 Tax=Calditerrivibrio nitroreducens (strain DSM 19672 / NBRC 101217 / Yu37-1) TaxID=768670 RepID=E4TJ27_CALNY|nr:Sir2 family NAD-dependent protein deacetylase [Calditerrivibrio nitroreducens]ADR19159.1 Silent information regulator protein Sir2 [Calditerrivibrio nitroreducens DSM 19672]